MYSLFLTAGDQIIADAETLYLEDLQPVGIEAAARVLGSCIEGSRARDIRIIWGVGDQVIASGHGVSTLGWTILQPGDYSVSAELDGIIVDRRPLRLAYRDSTRTRRLESEIGGKEGGGRKVEAQQQ